MDVHVYIFYTNCASHVFLCLNNPHAGTVRGAVFLLGVVSSSHRCDQVETQDAIAADVEVHARVPELDRTAGRVWGGVGQDSSLDGC